MATKWNWRASVAIATLLAGQAQAADPTVFTTVGPDQLSFSTDNMDLSTDPRKDFYRYASGKWQDRIERPERLTSVGTFDFMVEHLKGQMETLLGKAAEEAKTAEKGSPAQLVGDFYASFMDLDRIDARGMEPLKPSLARVDAIASMDDLADYMGTYLVNSGDVALAGIGPSQDLVDAKVLRLYLVSGRLGLSQRDIYREKDGSPRLEAYRSFVKDVLKTAGSTQDKAEGVADLVIAIERRMEAAQLTDVESVDPRSGYNPQPLDVLQKQIPEIDLTRIIKAMKVDVPEQLVLSEPRYFPELSKILRDYSLPEIKEYLKFKLVLRFLPYLGSAFDAPSAALNKAVFGVGILAKRSERAQSLLREYLGQPVSQLYVQAYFSDETRQKATDMVGRIHEAFVARVKTRDWLTEETRKAALEKLEALTFEIGYPEKWIDFSSVDVRRDDVVANAMNLIAFDSQRELSKLGKPVVHESFSNTRATLPIIINAAYDSQINGFEVPAAILQPAAFEATRDAPVYFCRLGAVIGHEMTHGFDSGGRLFDAKGNLRDWWTPADAAAFEKEAQKLIDQTNATEILPGLKGNGPLNVKENMADVGGINLAYDALKTYLAAHPQEDVLIDGMTPAQRCFVAWTQLWTDKVVDQALRVQVSSDFHPPNKYRAVAALQHVDGFYEAFGIKEGDPMWLPPERRVHAW